MKILKRLLYALLILVLLVLITAVIYVRHISQRAIPDYHADVVIEELIDEVEVYRDDLGVPHVYAKNPHDLYVVTGYLHAQDRLWQMDLLRRVTQGRLSEIFGTDMLDADQLFRALKFDEKSQQMLENMPEELSACLDAYSRGVNLFLEQNSNKLPFEFSILGYRPDPWLPAHTTNLLGYFTWGLTSPWSNEITLWEVSRAVGKEKMLELMPDLDLHTPVFDHYGQGQELAFKDNLLHGSLAVADLGLEVFSASNNWAAEGARSATGAPIICNDMHLQNDMAPGIWYQMHQVIEGELNVTGVIVAGTPVIACGHNDSIAWGFTNVSVDDMDFYLETINPEDTNQYLYDGAWHDMELVGETIHIKGGEPVKRVNRYTHRGPVISGFKDIEDAVVSMRWMGMEESNEFKSLFLYNRARNWEEFTAAARYQQTLSQNVVYGDAAGNIGMYTCAGIPVRKSGDGGFVLPGDTSLYEWTGRVPFEEQPHVYNPGDGYVISANNKTVTSGYPYYISHWFSVPSRYDRINELLEGEEELDVADFERIQTDQVSSWARRFQQSVVPVLAETELSAQEEEAFDMLGSWDCHMGAESGTALLYEVFYEELVRAIYSDELEEDLFERVAGLESVDYAFERIHAGQEISWCDDVTTDKNETYHDMVVRAFRAAVSGAVEQYGADMEQWQCGESHQITFAHALSSVNLLNKVFGLTRGPYPVGGSYHTVAPYSFRFGSGFEVYHGASQRHIYVAGQWDRSRTVIPSGVSGIPASEFFCNQSELYVNKQYHSDYFQKEKVVEAARFRALFTKE